MFDFDNITQTQNICAGCKSVVVPKIHHIMGLNVSVQIALIAEVRYFMVLPQVRSFVFCCVLCLIRSLWLPDVRLECQSGCVDVIPSQWYCSRHRKSFHCHLCHHVIPYFTLLWQVIDTSGIHVQHTVSQSTSIYDLPHAQMSTQTLPFTQTSSSVSLTQQKSCYCTDRLFS